MGNPTPRSAVPASREEAEPSRDALSSASFLHLMAFRLSSGKPKLLSTLTKTPLKMDVFVWGCP